MRYRVLATDYDGTLAAAGRVDDVTLDALERTRASGRRLILVTGRELEDLERVMPRLDLFDRVVAENGALLYCPATREERRLAEPPPAHFIATLRGRGVTPLSTGRVIVATWQPHETTVLETLRDLGLELQVIFNKGAVMVLPTGVNKATGLRAALAELGLSLRNCVGVGDAENDQAFLTECECAVAVANALEATRSCVDWVTVADHGAGVRELIDALLAQDLRPLDARLTRHEIELGSAADGAPVRVPPYGANILIAGTSGSGKSTLATGFLERLTEHGYQFCIIDPEGDYATLDMALVLGDEHDAPGVEETLAALEKPEENLVLNLVGLPFADRPAFFERLIPRLEELRLRTSRPHWIILDEAHHLLPAQRKGANLLSDELQPLLLITVHPEHLAPSVLKTVDIAIAIGKAPGAAFAELARAAQQSAPAVTIAELPPGAALLWHRGTPAAVSFQSAPPRTARRRHVRKYAQGELAPESSFYFHGPEGKLNLRAQNLAAFLQLADGIDAATWDFHLRRGDYSRWFRDSIKDEQLAQEAVAVEQSKGGAKDSRARIRQLIEARYTGAA